MKAHYSVLHIALDTNLIIKLAAFDQINENIKNKMFQFISMGKTGFSNMAKRNVCANALLKSEFHFDQNDKCAELEEVAQIYYMIQQGAIVGYILPTVGDEIDLGKKRNSKKPKQSKWDMANNFIYKAGSPLVHLTTDKDGKLVIGSTNLRKLYVADFEVILPEKMARETVLNYAEEKQNNCVVPGVTINLSTNQREKTVTLVLSAMVDESNSNEDKDDARIVAEASFFGLHVLTCNIKHFVSYEEHYKHFDKIRASIIAVINSLFPNEVPTYLGETPISVEEFLEDLTKGDITKYMNQPLTKKIAGANYSCEEYEDTQGEE